MRVESLGDLGDAAVEQWADELAGRVLNGRYRIDTLLGHGGMGGVFRGTHVSLGKPVAIKILHEELRLNPQFRRRFEQEALAASRLSHPNCVDVTDVGEDGELSYMVMPLVSGVELRELMSSSIELDTALSIGQQILAALEHAHSQGVVHRDVKPENILVSTDHRGRLQVKLLDFGLAKVIAPGDRRRVTAAGQVFGTPRYMSPEQARGTEATAQSDLYSTGLILYELLSGSPVYDSEDPLELVHLHMFGPGPRLCAVVPEATIPVLRRLLAKSADERFGSADQARRALEGAWVRGHDVPGFDPREGAGEGEGALPSRARSARLRTQIMGEAERPRLTAVPNSSGRATLALSSLEMVGSWRPLPTAPRGDRHHRGPSPRTTVILLGLLGSWIALAMVTSWLVMLGVDSTWVGLGMDRSGLGPGLPVPEASAHRAGEGSVDRDPSVRRRHG